ncbi:hypothetical protein [Catellatospora sichuanensis]|uniref:hypothetical protein n=1 Tax=Catellatospora sichuanensis TaxID=1969805 RepID=UPI001182897E|nr:hypothetical protein [Catellatospora sichuanensis]
MNYTAPNFSKISTDRYFFALGMFLLAIGFFFDKQKSLITGGVLLIVGQLMRVETAIRQRGSD